MAAAMQPPPPRQWRWSDETEEYDDEELAMGQQQLQHQQQQQQQQYPPPETGNGGSANDEGPVVDGDALADGYQMLEELGSGSFGIVYKAIEKSSGEIVAIKHVDLESSEEDISDIQAEIAVLSSCASPYVTQYKTAFLRGQKLWIVMEYLGGGSCQDLLKPGVMTEAHIAIIMRELLKGLVYLHASGKLHRDIKAANILLSNAGRVKLADFGVAAQLTNIQSLRNTFVGTPFWMAPEVIQQAGHDGRADVWSLGITAMELAMGEPPHANVHPMKVLFLIPKNPAPRLEGRYGRDFRDFVARCLEKDADRRPTAKELLKHRFVARAGKVEQLQELVIRRQEWESGREGGERRLKYYAETMRSLQIRKPEEDVGDEWVFDTVRPTQVVNAGESQGTMRQVQTHTQKRRKLTGDRMEIDVKQDVDSVAAMEGLSLESSTPLRKAPDQELSSTMRKISASAQKIPQSPSVQQATRRRVPSTQHQQKQPLGVNMSFGNSPSTVRQFRRVSPGANSVENVEPNVKKENSQKHSRVISNVEVVAPPPPPGFSSVATTIAPESKEVALGRRIYKKAVGMSCQEVLNNTADQEKRETMSRLAEAFSDLEMTDPEGLYHVMMGVMSKMAQDPKLSQLLPTTALPASPPPSQPDSQLQSHTSTLNEQSGFVTPKKAGEKVNAAKLVLAQNNPHLKSHRRRQSAQMQRLGSEGDWTPLGSPMNEEKEMLKLMPGQQKGGLEHTRVLGDVLFERWCEGLRNRWPAV